MSLDTYANLKAEIITWSHRDDIDLLVDTFIDMAESKMLANEDEPLKLRGEETLAAFATTTADRFVALPTGFQSARKIVLLPADSDPVEVYYRAPLSLNVLSTTGMPAFYTVTSQIEFNCISDQAYDGEIQYIKDFTPLSSSNTTNTVLTNHPTIYLFGALWALKLKTSEPEDAAFYYQQFIAAIRGANLKDAAGRYGPAPVMSSGGYVP
jgi:hypothetical protein